MVQRIDFVEPFFFDRKLENHSNEV